MVYRGFQIIVSHNPTTVLGQENFFHGRKDALTGEPLQRGFSRAEVPNFLV